MPQAITFGLSFVSRRRCSVAGPLDPARGWSEAHSSLRMPDGSLASGAALLIGIGLLVLRARGSTVDVLSTLHMVAYSRDLLVTILFLGLGIHAFLKRGPLWGCMVLVPVLQALASGSILSMTRIVLSSYPGFLDAAEIASSRAVFAITVVVFLFAQFVLLTVLCELDIRRVTGILLRDGALPPAQDRGFFRKATRRSPRRFGFFRVTVSSRTINHAGSRVRSPHRSG